MHKKIIIIGATSGIGRQMALLYLARGWQVGITGRRQALLAEMQMAYPTQVTTACFDVTDEKCLKSLSNLIDALGGLDVFIYNAGFGDVVSGLDEVIEITTVKTNVVGMVQLTAYVFNYFLQKGNGQIALLSSVAALRGNSFAPAYSASKAFCSIYAEGLNMKAYKLQKNIVVTNVKPGFINTKPSKGNKRIWVASPQKAARQIVKAIDNRKRHVYITKRWWLVAQLLKIMPFAFYKRLG